jgi:NAD+ synthase
MIFPTYGKRMETTVDEGQELKINPAFVRKMLVDFIRDETHNAGFRKAVIGLSGGVDSALSAYLAAEALGHNNVLAVLMPYKTSNPESSAHAHLVVEALKIRSEVCDITRMVDPYLETQKLHDKVRRGNVMARMRMIVLYDYSSRENALVVGTSNKTETMLGYGTLFGDTASAINPLGDLYKTQVWEMAKIVGVPPEIINKKPTADLWQGQTDEDELGFSYREADRLLYYMIDERRTDEELVGLGFDLKLVRQIKSAVRKNQFKRRPPVIAKISYRTVNVDFRYVRDWGI